MSVFEINIQIIVIKRERCKRRPVQNTNFLNKFQLSTSIAYVFLKRSRQNYLR